jgi:hypothetical protein
VKLLDWLHRVAVRAATWSRGVLYWRRSSLLERAQKAGGEEFGVGQFEMEQVDSGNRINLLYS